MGIWSQVVSQDKKVMTQYLHLKEIVASEGQIVHAGRVIAKIGNTGRCVGKVGPDYGTHLHFDVLIKNKEGIYGYVDPLKFFKIWGVIIEKSIDSNYTAYAVK